MNVKQAWALARQSMSSWSEDYAPSMGAALSYYTLFSIAPLLIIVIAVAGIFFGADAVQGVIFAQLQSLMGQEAAEAIQDMLATTSDPAAGGIATIVSVAGLAIGATTVFNELQNDLDRIWRAPARERSSGIWTLLRTRLLSFGMILAVAFLLTVSLVTSAALATIGKWWDGWFGAWEGVAYVLDVAINFGMLTLIFALIYKMIPRVHVAWRDVWVGAGVTSALFVLGKFLIGLYIGKSDMTSSFGAAGSMVLVMVWVYWSAQIFLFGAEFTWTYANLYGSRKEVAKREGTVPGAPQEVPAKSVENTGAPAADAGSAKPRAPRATDMPPIPIGTAPLTTRRAEPPYPVAPTSITTAAIAPEDASVRTSGRNKHIAVEIALSTALAIGIGVAARLHGFRRLFRHHGNGKVTA
ncbi:MAG TPA: YhjD/YihY/BrkB family envelope integrity protein [Burkholderiales bacterium]|nr:YhjD/YihY/BrkB family envelope integrity protein [Burkholderiales bacterium]